MWFNSYDRLTTDLRPFIKTSVDLYNQGIKGTLPIDSYKRL